MSEAISTNQSKAGKRWLSIATRVLVAVIMVIAAVGFIVNAAGLVGVWVARAPTSSGVTDVTATMTHALGIVDNGLTRVNTQVQDARQSLTRVNNAAANLGDRIQANSPLVTRLDQQVVNELAPRLENALARIQAIVNKYQAKVTDTQTRITSTSNTLLLLIDVLAVSLTLLFLIYAAGLVLLMYVGWRYVRTGRFPSLRVVST